MPILRKLTFYLVLSGLLASAQTPGNNWWKNAVIYEIYPRSFQDSNGDGIGDLNGIAKRLDYLKELGVDGIWITPFFPSPQVDFGYDISNYEAIDPQYGTMADFDRLLAEAKKRNIRVLADLVLNHTSDKHAWFRESSSSRTNPKADWYVWRDGKPGNRPPNNWISLFGHSAWQYVPARGQFYYHDFYKEQPDLNWRNPTVRKAMYDTVRFWMKRGVAGFRLDAITTLFEDPEFRDEGVSPGTNAYGDPRVSREYTDNLPEVHEVLRELRKVIEERPGTVLIGETYLPNVAELAKMYGAKNDELQLPMDTQYGFINHLSASDFRAKLLDAETKLNGNLPLLVFDNHDNVRSWNRYGDGKHDLAIAKLIATLLLAPRGSALVYYGQELGMPNTDAARKEDVQDPVGRLGWPKDKGRDGERTPMQWSAEAQAGFTTGKKTWLPVPPNYQKVNVEAETQDADSLLNYYKSLIRLRKQNPALHDGGFSMIGNGNNDVIAFIRKSADGRQVAVALNLSVQSQTANFSLPGVHARTLLRSFSGKGGSADLNKLELPPFGCYLGQVEKGEVEK